MSVCTDGRQRAHWIADAHRIDGEISDLRMQLDVALQSPTSRQQRRLLAEIDYHLEVAQARLADAIARAAQL